MRADGGVGTDSVAPAPMEATVLTFLVAATILLQRLALPLGAEQLPVVLPVVLTLLAWAARRGLTQTEPVRLQLYMLAISSCAVAALISLWRGLPWSLLSIIYLIVIYFPFCFHLRAPSRRAYAAGLAFFLKLMTLAAVVGIAQMAAQLLGLPYVDPLGYLPDQLLLREYNTSYPVIYGSPIFKTNGVFFLEPSFYSQFLALALITHLHLRRRGPAPYLYVAGIVASVSGTGIILAVVGSLFVAVSQRRPVGRLVAAGLAVGLIVAVTPVRDIFAARITESAASGSSAQGRFQAPYEIALAEVGDDPMDIVAGRGPGQAERLSRVSAERTGLVPVFPVIAKLVVEYGAPPTLLFMAFILTSVGWRVRAISLSASLVVMYLTLSGSLLQPATVYVMFAFTSLFADGRATAGTERLAFPGAVTAPLATTSDTQP